MALAPATVYYIDVGLHSFLAPQPAQHSHWQFTFVSVSPTVFENGPKDNTSHPYRNTKHVERSGQTTSTAIPHTIATT